MSLAGDLASVIDSFVAFFRPRPRRPSELISALMVAISRLGARESRVRSKAVVECGKYLYRLQVMVTRGQSHSF